MALTHDRSGSATPADAAAQQRLMAEFGIVYTGRHYEYEVYRYDRLADAVAYATLQRARGRRADPAASMPTRRFVPDPDATQRAVMAALAITYCDGTYRLGEYRYDRLDDAVDYARLQGQRAGASPGR